MSTRWKRQEFRIVANNIADNNGKVHTSTLLNALPDRDSLHAIKTADARFRHALQGECFHDEYNKKCQERINIIREEADSAGIVLPYMPHKVNLSHSDIIQLPKGKKKGKNDTYRQSPQSGVSDSVHVYSIRTKKSPTPVRKVAKKKVKVLVRTKKNWVLNIKRLKSQLTIDEIVQSANAYRVYNMGELPMAYNTIKRYISGGKGYEGKSVGWMMNWAEHLRKLAAK